MINYFKDWTKFELGLIFGSTLICLVVYAFGESQSFVEVVIAVTSLLSVVLAAKGKISNYVIGSVYVLLNGFVLLSADVFASGVINIFYYLPMNVIGIIIWKRNQNKENTEVKTRQLSLKMAGIIVIFSLICIPILSLLLTSIGGNVGLLDAATSVVYILAMYLQVMRYNETWFVWILVQIFNIVMWSILIFQQGHNDVNMLVMWVIHLINSIYGYVNWRKLSGNTDDSQSEAAENV